MYINSDLENSDIHKSLVNVTGLDSRLALSILKFVNLHGGCIAGSCALAMYLEKNNMPTFRPGDIDIYIPSRQSQTRVHYLDTKEMPFTHKPFLRNIDREHSYLSEDFGTSPSHWGDIDRMFVTEFSKHYIRVGNDIYKGTNDSYYLQITYRNNLPEMGNLPNMDNLKENEKEEVFGLLWTKISSFKRRDSHQRYIGDTYRYNGRNYDCSSLWVKNKTWCSVPPGHQEIQLIFLKENVDVSKYIAKNYDFSVCKVYTSLQALKQEHKLVSLHEESIKNRVLDIPNNWEYITIAACFKTVTRRFIKYTQRGFIPIHYKAFEAPLLKKQAIYDAMKKSSMKFNLGIVSDSVKMREESLKKLIEKDYNEEGMNGWRNFSQEKSSTPLADSYRKMTIMLKQYLYYKILQIYEKDGPESFRDDTAGGIYILLHEDINNLIDDFQPFDMVKFWKSIVGKAILRQISGIPENSDSDSDSDNNVLTFSDEDLILSKSILTSFLEDIKDLLGRALWFLFNKTVTERKPFPTTGQTWNQWRTIDFPVSKEHPGLLSAVLRVFNDDGSIKSKFNNQAEFLAEISEPSINRMYRNRATHHNDEGVEESKSGGIDSFEEYGDNILSQLSEPRRSDSQTYNKDPEDIHIRTLISNIEDLQGLGTHNKETVVRNIRSNLRGGRRKKLMRFIMKDS
ncbi:MAG: hypothetical protein Ct9H90mP28_0110 [Paracoccaceae bacterium]|nr:MAG: hypothetical protein Ct9H90mP28_0110 [Paracoccaceae bacterium]